MAYKVIWKAGKLTEDVDSRGGSGDAFATRQEAEAYKKFIEKVRRKNPKFDKRIKLVIVRI